MAEKSECPTDGTPSIWVMTPRKVICTLVGKVGWCPVSAFLKNTIHKSVLSQVMVMRIMQFSFDT